MQLNWNVGFRHSGAAFRPDVEPARRAVAEQSSEQVGALYDQGGKHLAKMRELVSSRGPIGPRSDAFGTEATALLGVIASLQQISIASAVKRTADDLAAGFIARAAGGQCPQPYATAFSASK